MTADNLYLTLVITAFLIFGAGLLYVSIYVRLGDRKPAAQASDSTQAKWVEDQKAA